MGSRQRRPWGVGIVTVAVAVRDRLLQGPVFRAEGVPRSTTVQAGGFAQASAEVNVAGGEISPPNRPAVARVDHDMHFTGAARSAGTDGGQVIDNNEQRQQVPQEFAIPLWDVGRPPPAGKKPRQDTGALDRHEQAEAGGPPLESVRRRQPPPKHLPERTVRLWPESDGVGKHADVAMYEAKGEGRNNHAPYRPEMSAKATRKLSLAGELRRAVDCEEFRVHFQPKVEIQNGRMVGAEALIRWQHPERGLLAPSEFIGLAEELGLGPQIGDWLLWRGLSYCKRQGERGNRLIPIALNLSNSQFRVTGFLDRITQAISTYGLEPSCLELEITENMVVHNCLAACELLTKFKALGISIAIDDFGTGQSALGTLRSLPADALKIDRSFVRELGTSERNRAITASIIDIGHHLDMTVIAEGVETQQQLDMLGAMGCDQAQGFFFSRGLPAEEFERFLAETRVHATGGGQARKMRPSSRSAGRYSSTSNPT